MLEAGNILMANPFMQDPYFKRAVIILTEYKDDGAIGFVFNRPSFSTINEIVPDLEDCFFPVFIGGPVENNILFYLHKRPDLFPGSKKIVNDIYWGGDFEQVKTAINQHMIDEQDIRFFLGYAGWRRGQIADELKSQSWEIGQMHNDLWTAKETQTMWKDAMYHNQANSAFLSNFIENPSLN